MMATTTERTSDARLDGANASKSQTLPNKLMCPKCKANRKFDAVTFVNGRPSEIRCQECGSVRVFGLLNRSTHLPWSEREDEAIRAHYPEHGAKWEGWSKLLPNRTEKAIVSRAHAIDVGMTNEARLGKLRRVHQFSRTWTEDEDSLIREHYPAHGIWWREWKRLIPNHTQDSIASRASTLGVRKRGKYARWTEEEDATLIKHYPEHGSKWDGWGQLLPDRTPGAIQNRAFGFGLCVQQNDAWTTRERELVREHYPERGMAWDGWGEILPNRSVTAIGAMARSMGVRSMRGKYGHSECLCADLSDWEVEEAYEKRRKGVSLRRLGDEYGVNAKAIKSAFRRLEARDGIGAS